MSIPRTWPLASLALSAFCGNVHGSGVLLNIRDFGAVGDGRYHAAGEWSDPSRRRDFERLAGESPSVSVWSQDEAAFELAKRSLPPAGGTIYFPAGTYVATADSWRILRDHVRLLGDGPGRSVLTTGPRVAECLVLSGYRHVGWSRAYPFHADDGSAGTLQIRLSEPEETRRFPEGALVFVRDGANRFDQDYGEFNEVAHAGQGVVELTHPLARDYRLASVNWAGRTVTPFVMPAVGSPVDVVLSRETGFFLPDRGEALSVSGQSLRVGAVGRDGHLQLVNEGRGNLPPGARVDSGAPVAKERGLILLSASTRDFRCEGMTILGRRKALDISNSYSSAFVDCSIERRPDGARVNGGIVIDGDGGRFATFTRCTIRAAPPVGTQFARSFGDVAFSECRFVDCDAAFTEFCFNGSVAHSSFEVAGAPRFRDVIILGSSCGNIRIEGNTIMARSVDSVFDAQTDIKSFRHRGDGDFVVSDNRVETEDVGTVFMLDSRVPVTLERNEVSGNFRRLGSAP
jgi:hypothetical protein